MHVWYHGGMKYRILRFVIMTSCVLGLASVIINSIDSIVAGHISAKAIAAFLFIFLFGIVADLICLLLEHGNKE